MLRIVNISLVLLLFTSLANAQLVEMKEKNSGYLNKYNVIGFKAYVGASIQPQRAGKINETAFSINTAFSVDLERVLTNYSALQVSLGYAKTSVDIGTDLKEEFESYFNDFIFTGSDGLEYRVVGVSRTPSIKETSIGLTYKKYLSRRGAMAPLGGYVTLGAVSNRVEVDLSPTSFILRTERNYHDDEVLYRTVSEPISAKNLVKITLGFGHSAAVTERLIFTSGIEYGYMYVGVNQYEYSEELSKALEYIIYKRMQRKQIANYFLGLSYVF